MGWQEEEPSRLSQDPCFASRPLGDYELRDTKEVKYTLRNIDRVTPSMVDLWRDLRGVDER